MALFDVILAATLNNQAELYKEEGRYADAEPLYKRAPASTPEQKGSTPQFLDAFCLGLKEFGYVENLSRL